MAAVALSRPGASLKRGLAELGVALAIVALAAGSTWFVDEWGARRGIAMGAFVVLLCWLASTRRTPLALAVFMVYLGAIDGYAKLSTGSTAVTLVRDALLFAIVVGVLTRAVASGRRLPLPPLSGWVLAFVVLVLVQLPNPQAGTLTHSLAGIRQHLEFIPLFFLAFAFVRTTAALRWFVVLLVAIAAANGVASWAQFRLTPEQFAAWGPGYAERVLSQGRFSESGRTFARVGESHRTRPFGLGSDAGSGGMMGALALAGLFALAMTASAKRLRYLVFAAVMALGVAVAIITSQGRSAVVAAVAVVLLYLLLTATSRGGVERMLGVAVAALIMLVLTSGLISAVGTRQLRYDGLTSSRILDTTKEARGSALAATPENFVNHPLGAGLGTAGPASGVAGASELTGVLDAETWFSFITLETGLPGLLLMTGFTLTLLGLALTRCRHEPDPEARLLLGAALAPVGALLLLYFVGGGLTASTPFGPYLWAVGGIAAYWLIARPAELRRA